MSGRLIALSYYLCFVCLAGIPLLVSLAPRGPVFVLVVSVITVIAMLFLGFLFHKRATYVWRAMTISVVFVASIGYSNWPLQIAFRFSKNEFERVENTFTTDQKSPSAVGFFQILKVAKLSNGSLFFKTDESEIGATGFIKDLDMKSVAIWSSMDLGNGWKLVVEE